MLFVCLQSSRRSGCSRRRRVCLTDDGVLCEDASTKSTDTSLWPQTSHSHTSALSVETSSGTSKLYFAMYSRRDIHSTFFCMKYQKGHLVFMFVWNTRRDTHYPRLYEVPEGILSIHFGMKYQKGHPVFTLVWSISTCA